jgi:hypothetical protein
MPNENVCGPTVPWPAPGGLAAPRGPLAFGATGLSGQETAAVRPG